MPIKFKDTILSSQQFQSYILVLMPDPKFRFQIESAAQGNRLAKLPLYHSSSSDFIKLPLDIRTFDTCTANPFPVMITGISLCSNSHREFPVMNT